VEQMFSVPSKPLPVDASVGSAPAVKDTLPIVDIPVSQERKTPFSIWNSLNTEDVTRYMFQFGSRKNLKSLKPQVDMKGWKKFKFKKFFCLNKIPCFPAVGVPTIRFLFY